MNVRASNPAVRSTGRAVCVSAGRARSGKDGTQHAAASGFRGHVGWQSARRDPIHAPCYLEAAIQLCEIQNSRTALRGPNLKSNMNDAQNRPYFPKALIASRLVFLCSSLASCDLLHNNDLAPTNTPLSDYYATPSRSEDMTSLIEGFLTGAPPRGYNFPNDRAKIQFFDALLKVGVRYPSEGSPRTTIKYAITVKGAWKEMLIYCYEDGTPLNIDGSPQEVREFESQCKKMIADYKSGE